LGKPKKNISYKIRISLLLLGGLLAFYWIYFEFLGFSLEGIDKANVIKQELPEYIEKKQYNESIKKNFYLLYLDSSQKYDNYWNLASAYYLLSRRETAKKFYDSLLLAPRYQARAWHQLGNILYLESKDSIRAALEAYRKALYLQENNLALAYNYELLKKIDQRNNPSRKQYAQKQNQSKQSNQQNPKEPQPTEEPPNEFLEAISNQEQEQLKKYQLKKAKFVKKEQNLPDW
jgi:tetratricopeptide (TPR) repeat protein